MKDTFAQGDKIGGFVVERVFDLPDIRANAVLLRHEASAARFLDVHAAHDNENALAVTFPTPPVDDTGVTHIIEHSVLAGSEKFPVREPFFEMIKMSLATFINALTYQTYTCYPVSSPVRKDFFNLAEVYLDAVFHPLLTRETFMREGHHLAFSKPGDTSSPLSMKGVVFSEMQGYASSPENRIYYLAHQMLYPGNPLGRESGGDPAHIPELSFEEFREFHAKRYHPSNALVFHYGDIPLEDVAAFLDKALAGFSAPAPMPVQTQPCEPPKAPIVAVERYPVGATDPIEDADYLTLHWVVGDATDPETFASWGIIDALLVGHDAAPLRKALVDSGLGADTFFTGTSSQGWMQEFHAGLKGSRLDRVDQFERLVFDTLSEWASKPPESYAVEAAFQQVAYSSREVQPRYPLAVLSSVNLSWPYGGSPVAFLSPRELLETCRRRWLEDPLYFGKLVRSKLLDNPYRLRLALCPDRDFAAREAASLAESLEKRRAAFSQEELAEIDREASRLEALNGVANTPEKLALLPQLSKGDLPDKPVDYPVQKGEAGGVALLRNEVFANGVDYLAMRIDLTGIPDELREPLVGFVSAWNKMGASGQDYAAIAARRASCTGGLLVTPTYGYAVAGALREDLVVSLRTLDESAGEAFDLFADIFFGVDASDPARLRDILAQSIASCRETFMEEGYTLARECAARDASVVSALAYQFGENPDSLHALEAFSRDFDARAAKMAADVGRIREFLLDPRRWAFSFTGSDGVFEELRGRIPGWVARAVGRNPTPPPIPAPRRGAPACFRRENGAPLFEGIAVPGTVAYCSIAMPAPDISDPVSPLLEIGANILSSEFCLPEVRFKGQAYAAGASYSSNAGLFALNSGWDPHVAGTLKTYRSVLDYLAKKPWTQADIDRAIILSSSQAVAPTRPSPATVTTLLRHSSDITWEFRAERYRMRRAATADSVREALESLFERALPVASTCVVASQEGLEEAKRDPLASAMKIVNP